VNGWVVLRLGIPLLLLAIVACTPTLNWREVRLAALTTFLPCKPDQAERTMRLGNADVVMEETGCETSDTVYAISHVAVYGARMSPETVDMLFSDLRLQ